MTMPVRKGLWVLGLIAMIAGASAPADAAEINVRIPFDFMVSGKTLPQGSYTVSTAQSAMFVRGFGRGVVVLTNRVESRSDDQAKLVFHKYGEHYVLRQAWTGGGDGRELRPTSEERELAKAARNGKPTAAVERVVIPAL